MICQRAERPNRCRARPEAQSKWQSPASGCRTKAPRTSRHRTSTQESHAKDRAGPRCKGSDGRHVAVGRRREPVGREAGAMGTPPRQIAIGMLNEVEFGDLVKLLWWDGDGLCLFAKRLERGRFVWPRAEEGVIVLSRAQLSMLLEGIDWRMPQRTWRPELAG